MPADPAAPPPTRTIQLGTSGQQARIEADELGGHELFIGGRVQSHVDLADPTHVRYEYLRRIATVIDEVTPAGAPLAVLHLGAGALTLVRYVQATRPASTQVVVDIDRELVDFVTTTLPLPAGTDLEVVVGDAREAVAELAGERFDVVVLDVPSNTPETGHLAGPDFHLELLDLLTEQGVLLVNVGDDDGLEFLAGQVRSLEEAATTEGHDGCWVLADAGMLDHLALGNAVLAVGRGLRAAQAALAAAGPHPGAVLDPAGAAALADRIEQG
ncbi:spermidine synthase [Kytococcus sedentarius]|uniref:spermidine synthase n=1 Tax=Kytococcus sedentarius TaxID=1276 RepID=UPI00194E8203|nr:fused MFS/spermidine synthase [Kytococcus sedentarius]QRO87464.1 fused MFS/spermidine synthase [Kytococcus sedentarius]